MSLFDGTLQGLARTDKPAFCFQGHPEATPGPHDIGYLFDRFVDADGDEREHACLSAPTSNRILIIGAGPIVIGQACEFDYSGAQACKALREEGYRVILVNCNPATIMTDPEMADVTYIEPITWQMVEKIIAKERPDALLPTMGGQTALNCALDLHTRRRARQVRRRDDRRQREGDRQGRGPPEVQGRDDRASACDSAKRGIAHSMEEALAVQQRIDARDRRHRLSVVIRPELHARRHRRRHRLQPGGVRGDLQARPRPVADQASC